MTEKQKMKETWTVFEHGIPHSFLFFTVRHVAPTSEQINTLEIEQLTAEYEHGKSLLHAIIGGSLPWHEKSRLVTDIITKVGQEKGDMAVINLLTKQSNLELNHLGNATGGDTILHRLAYERLHAKKSALFFIHNTINEIVAISPRLRYIRNSQGLIPGNIVNLLINRGEETKATRSGHGVYFIEGAVLS